MGVAFCLAALNASAAIYRCENSAGNPFFSDKPCGLGRQERVSTKALSVFEFGSQEFQGEKTAKSVKSLKKTSKKKKAKRRSKRKIKRKLKRPKKNQTKQLLLKQKRAQKKATQHLKLSKEKKRKRRLRCQGLAQKMTQIQRRFHQGYRMKRGERLQEELDHYRLLYRRLCIEENG